MTNVLTLKELKAYLSQMDEVTLLEALSADSSDIVEKFTDEIIENFDKLKGLIDDGFDDSSDE